MAVFQSKYRELSFYVDGELYAFSSGSFSTDSEEVIAVLETIADAIRVDETQPEGTEAAAPKAPRKTTSAK